MRAEHSVTPDQRGAGEPETADKAAQPATQERGQPASRSRRQIDDAALSSNAVTISTVIEDLCRCSTIVYRHDDPKTLERALEKVCGGVALAIRDLRRDPAAAARSSEYWKAEHLAANAEIERLRNASHGLINEVMGSFTAFEFEIRPVISNTNYQCIMDKVLELKALVISRPSPEKAPAKCGKLVEGAPCQNDTGHDGDCDWVPY